MGGWTIGTIFNFQTGTPFLLGGGSGNGDPTTASTFNNDPNADGLGDGGVVLHGVTVSQLQSAIGVYHIPNSTQVSLINPNFWLRWWSESDLYHSQHDTGHNRAARLALRSALLER